MTRRILQIIPTLDRGGAEKQLVLLATGLPRDRFDVHVCLLTRGGPWLTALQTHDIPVMQVDKRHKIDPPAYFRLKRILQHLKPDLVHTWIFAANCYGRQAAFQTGVRRVVAGERCVDSWKAWHELAIDRYLARKTDRIATNSSGVVDFYIQHGIPAEKFTVIPNGIDPDPTSPWNRPGSTGATPRPTLRDELKIDDRSHLIGVVGRLWPQKRHKDLIWALNVLQEARGDTHLVIVGDGPERARLERYARLVHVDHLVHFLGERDDVPQLLPQFDCLWLASGYEGQSNAILEAMSAERPVVVTDIPGNRDLVVPKQTGFLVPVGDRTAFARWTNLLLDDRDLAARLGRAGRQRILQEFSVDKMVQRHVSLYDELL